MTSRSFEHTTQPMNTYVIDAESAAEQARLLDQDTLLTEAMGGPLSEQSEEALRGVRDVLDIGCGPGGWVQRVARDYPQMHVTGIDLSTTMIAYAQALACVMRLDNAHFRVMDAARPLGFPDASFDLVNARLVSGFLLPAQWPLLMAECQRLLRPGGIVRLTEGEWGIVTAAAPATARLFGLGLDALHRAGRSFSPDGRYHAITPMLCSSCAGPVLATCAAGATSSIIPTAPRLIAASVRITNCSSSWASPSSCSKASPPRRSWMPSMSRRSVRCWLRSSARSCICSRSGAGKRKT